MKKYNLTPQERDNFCVCSVLQAVFRKYGLEYSQEQIALELTPSENGFHIDDSRMNHLMERENFDYTFFKYNETPFNEPDMLLRDMNSNHGIIGINSHVFLLSYFRDPVLSVIDPGKGEKLEKNLYEVLNDMKNLYGGFGLIKHINRGQLHLKI